MDPKSADLAETLRLLSPGTLPDASATGRGGVLRQIGGGVRELIAQQRSPRAGEESGQWARFSSSLFVLLSDTEVFEP